MQLFGYGQRAEESLAGAGKLRALQGLVAGGVEPANIRLTVLTPDGSSEGMCTGDSGGPAFVAAADVAGYRGDARVRAWQAAHATGRLQPLVQVGVLSSLSGAECEGGSSEYVSVAAYAEWLEEAVRELGGAKLARIKNKVPL